MNICWFWISHFKYKSFSWFLSANYFLWINLSNKRVILLESEKQRGREIQSGKKRESLTLPTSPALFSEGTCCAILGRGPESEKRQAEEVQQDGEKGKMGGRSRAGCSQQMGDKGAPCPGTQRSGWSTGRLASWLVNVQMNMAVLSHSSPNHV